METTLSTRLAERIREETGENVFLCYQCIKCTSGCPLAEYFDLAPNQVLRAAQLGMEERLFESRTPWLCASCQTCTTRCPQGIDVARVMDFLTAEARRRGVEPKVPDIALFHKVFLRDVDVLAAATARVEVTVNVSIPTLDDRIWRTTEPGTAHPRQRLRAVRRLADAGIRVGVGMAPILPGLSDDPDLLRQVVLAARQAGAAFLWWNVLNLRPGTREHFLDRLAQDWPEQLDRYQRLYDGRAYLTKDATRPLDLLMTELRSEWVWEPRRRTVATPTPESEGAQLVLPLAG